MTDYQSDRLDRIEALVESNARALEAMGDNVNKWQQESQRDRSRLYQAMTQLAQTQANFYERLDELEQRQDDLSRRQREIVEILKLLTQKLQ
ncbi:MAG: hypothetical protein GDA43_20725 [Hormoscilla sp. SP5CHS1]|nr:hypothetical protein [Hormoscilla sp. SP12CHS1]MBC6455324.1 hypothetical protein [Hormoscilla sp. SP5CHS1]